MELEHAIYHVFEIVTVATVSAENGLNRKGDLLSNFGGQSVRGAQAQDLKWRFKYLVLRYVIKYLGT